MKRVSRKIIIFSSLFLSGLHQPAVTPRSTESCPPNSTRTGLRRAFEIVHALDPEHSSHIEAVLTALREDTPVPPELGLAATQEAYTILKKKHQAIESQEILGTITALLAVLKTGARAPRPPTPQPPDVGSPAPEQDQIIPLPPNISIQGNLAVGKSVTVSGTTTLSDNLILLNQKQIRLCEATAGGTSYAALQAPAALDAPYTLTLPPALATANGQALVSTTGGALSWSTIVMHNPVSIGGIPNGLSIDGIGGQVLSLASASATDAGAVTAVGQTFGGDKTFNEDLRVNGTTNLAATTVVGTTSINGTGAALTTIGNNTGPSTIHLNGLFHALLKDQSSFDVEPGGSLNIASAATTQYVNIATGDDIQTLNFGTGSAPKTFTIGNGTDDTLTINSNTSSINANTLLMITGPTNINQGIGVTAGTTIGNAVSTTTVGGTININTTGTRTTSIGTHGTTTVIAGSTNINTGTSTDTTTIGNPLAQTIINGPLNINGNTIFNAGNTISWTTLPTLPAHLANKEYVDYVGGAGIKVNDPVYATDQITNIDITSTVVPVPIDGASVPANTRVLLNHQTTPTENGLWLTPNGTGGAWTRPTDWTGNPQGFYTFVENGIIYAASSWVCSATGPIPVSNTWSLFSRSADYQMSNVGTGAGTAQVYKEKIGRTFFLKSLKSGSNVSVSNDGTDNVLVDLITNPTITGNLSVNGDTTLGNATDDTLTIKGIAISIAPSTTINTEDGIGDLNIMGISSGTLNLSKAGQLTAIAGNATVTGTLDVTGTTSLATGIGDQTVSIALGNGNKPVHIADSGSGSKTISIGSATTTTTLLGAANINTSGIAATTIGSSGSATDVTLQTSSGTISLSGTTNINTAISAVTTIGNFDTDGILVLNPAFHEIYLGAIPAAENRFLGSLENDLALGYRAGPADVTPSYHNTVIGPSSGTALNTGSYNSILGSHAAETLTDGQKNVFVGSHAGQNSTIASFSTLVGYNAGFRLGETGTVNIDAIENVGIGHFAIRGNDLSDPVTGNYNTAIGTSSLQNLTTGSSNTVLGNKTGQTLTTGSNNMYIGKEVDAATPTENNTVRIGNALQTTWYIPAGTSIDTTSSGSLSIGGARATTLNLGRSGQTTDIKGNLQVEGTIGFIGKTVLLNRTGLAGTGSLCGLQVEEGGTVTGSALTSADRTSWNFLAPHTTGYATLTPGAAGFTISNQGSGVNMYTITSTPTSVSTYTIPAVGTSNFVMTAGNQSIDGTKTVTSALIINPATNQLVLGGVGGGNTTTITAPAPAVSRMYTIPDAGGAANFILSATGSSQTITGNLTINDSGTATTTIGSNSTATNVTVQTSGGTITVTGATNINATGGATTTIGNETTPAVNNIVGTNGINAALTVARTTTIGTAGFGTTNILGTTNITGTTTIAGVTGINITGTSNTTIGNSGAGTTSISLVAGTTGSIGLTGTTNITGATNINTTGTAKTTIASTALTTASSQDVDIATGNVTLTTAAVASKTVNLATGTVSVTLAAGSATETVNIATGNLTTNFAGAAASKVVNIATGTVTPTLGSASKTINIGATPGTTTNIRGTTNINTTGTATTTIGSNTTATNIILRTSGGSISTTGTTNLNTTGGATTTIGNTSAPIVLDNNTTLNGQLNLKNLNKISSLDPNRTWPIQVLSNEPYYGRVKTTPSFDPQMWGHLGNTWTNTSDRAAYSCLTTSADARYQLAGVTGGRLWQTSTFGLSWAELVTDRLNWTGVAMSTDGKYQTAVADGQQIARSGDYGTSWTPVATVGIWKAVAVSANGQYQSAVGTDERIRISSDYGNLWTESGSDKNAWSSIAISADGMYQAATITDGDIWQSTNYGVSWTAPFAQHKTWKAIAMSADGKYQTVVAESQGIWRSTDYGTSWNQVNSDTFHWISVAMSADGQIQAAAITGLSGTDVAVYFSTDYGTTWDRSDAIINGSLVAVAMSATGNYTLVAENALYIRRSVFNPVIEGIFTVNGTTALNGNATVTGTFATTGATNLGNSNDDTTTIRGNTVLDTSTSATGIMYKASVSAANRFIHNPGTNNTFVGVSSGALALTGADRSKDNVAIGKSAGAALQNGSVAGQTSGNVLVGSSAAATLTTGYQNTIVGNLAGSSYTTESNNMCIGYNVTGTAGESNKIRIGNSSNNACFITGIRGITTGVVDAVPVLIDSANQLGTVSSSRKYKENVRDMGTASSKLDQLRPVCFNYKSDATKKCQYGLIAEEVAEVMPDLVVYKNGQPETVHYEKLPALLLNELQKMRRLTCEQTHTIAALEACVIQQAQTIAAIEARMAMLE